MFTRKEIQARYRASHKEQIKEKSKIYYKKNKDKIIAYAYKWAEHNPEKRRFARIDWEHKNPEYKKKFREYNKKYCNRYYQENREDMLQKAKEWRINNPIKSKQRIAEYNNRRKAFMLNVGELPLKTIQMVYEDNIKKYGTLTCYLCSNSISFGLDEIEHKIPLSRGGTNDYENIGVSCRRCNRSKHDKTVDEFKREGAYV